VSLSDGPTRATRGDYELFIITPFGLQPVPYFIWVTVRAIGGTTAWKEL
jgi:hypothetical protein